MKTCFKCKIEKPLDEFYRHSQMADGHLNKCKDCARMDSSARLGEKADQIRKYERARAHRPNRRVLARASHKRWYEKHREEILAKNKNNPKKEARRLAAYAVKTGKIEKFPCEKCGSIKVHAHHDDYDNPLKVRWLCSKCHAEEHHGPRPIDPYAWKYGV